MYGKKISLLINSVSFLLIYNVCIRFQCVVFEESFQTEFLTE